MEQHHDSAGARESGVTYHLVPVGVWERARDAETYVPEAFNAEGFIHCTNGTDQLVAVANLFYANDSREFLVLALDVTKIQADVRYDDPGLLFPHIYGPLNTSAVIGELPVSRSSDGTFLAIGPA